MQPDDPYPQPSYAPPAQGGQPPYAQPTQGQPPYAQPAQGQPPYAQPAQGQPPYAQLAPPPYAQPAPPPYLATTDAARAVKERKGKRDIAFGVVWLAAGLLITGVTLASTESPIVVVAWGPVLWGLFQIVRGTIAVSRNRQ
jgi:hypothetical protein